MDLSFLNPWLLLGLAGAALPIIIHLIGRRNAPTQHFAAFDFLMAVNRRLARREKLRQWLLLLMRTLALVALVIAVARPVPPHQSSTTDIARKLLLIVDNSASMGYVHEGKSLLEHAKARAAQLITHLEPGDALTLVVAGGELETPFQSPTLNHQAVREGIQDIELSRGSANLGAAIEQALAQVNQKSEGVTLAVISDLAATSFGAIHPSALVPAPTVQLIDAAGRERPQAFANIGVESLKIEPTGISSNERRFVVGLRNYGPAAVTRCGIELVVGNQVKQRGFISLEPFSPASKVLTVNFAQAGHYAGELRLQSCEGDGFALDDRFYFVVDISKQISVLAVNGEPRSRPYDDELFFVERALEAIPAGSAPIHLKMVTATELNQDPTLSANHDVILLANVGSLVPPVVQKIAAHVQAGGGLLLTLGSHIGFESLNETMGELLPHPLRDLHREADPVLGAPPVGLQDFQRAHPIFSGMDTAFELGLQESQTRSYFNLAVGSGIHARVLMRFANGAPALLESMGEQHGRVMLLATSVDLGLTDLALRPAFPAFLQRTVRYLGGSVVTGYRRMGRVGEALQSSVPTGAKGLRMGLENEEPKRIPMSSHTSSRVKLKGLLQVGIYRAEVLNGQWTQAPALDIAMNPTLAESDFRPVDPQDVAKALGAGTDTPAVTVALTTDGQTDPFQARGYASVALICLGCFFLTESLLASRG